MKYFRLVFLLAAVLLSSVAEAVTTLTFSVPIKISNSLATEAQVDCTVYQGSAVMSKPAHPPRPIVIKRGNYDGVVSVEVWPNPALQLTGRETYTCKLLLKGTNGAYAEPSVQSTDPGLKAKPGTPLKTAVSGNL
jgi:hypothetical protein